MRNSIFSNERFIFFAGPEAQSRVPESANEVPESSRELARNLEGNLNREERADRRASRQEARADRRNGRQEARAERKSGNQRVSRPDGVFSHETSTSVTIENNDEKQTLNSERREIADASSSDSMRVSREMKILQNLPSLEQRLSHIKKITSEKLGFSNGSYIQNGTQYVDYAGIRFRAEVSGNDRKVLKVVAVNQRDLENIGYNENETPPITPDVTGDLS